MSASSSHSIGEESGNSSGKTQNSESTLSVVPDSSAASTTTTTTSTQSNGSLSKDEARVILASDTPTESGSEFNMSEMQSDVPDSQEPMQSQASGMEAPLFGRSAASTAESQSAEHTGSLAAEVNAAKSPARLDAECSSNAVFNEPEVITISSSSSVTDSPIVPSVAETSSDELKLQLDTQSDHLKKVEEALAKSKQAAENSDPKSPQSKSQSDSAGPRDDAAKEKQSNADGGGKDTGKASDGKSPDKSGDGQLPEVDIEEPIKVKYVTPLGEPEAASAHPETSDQTDSAEKTNSEEKDEEEGDGEDEAEEVEESPRRKRGGAAARGRSRGRGGRRSRGRVSKASPRGRSPRHQQHDEEEPEESETPNEEAGKEKEAVDEPASKEVPEETEKAGQEEEKATSPKRKTRRSTIDRKMAAEGKAQGVTPDQPETETRRVLRNRYQSPVDSGSGQEARTSTKRRRAQHSTSSGDELRESDVEKTSRRKRAAAKAATPVATPERQTRPKRARLASGEQQQQRSASSDSEPKEEKRSRRSTRAADASVEGGESSKPTSAKRTSAARGRRSQGGSASASRKSNDVFDFDESADQAPAGPFRRVNLSKSNFGDIKYTKAFEKSGDKNKYTVTSKAAELKKQHTGDTVILLPQISDSLSDSPPLYRVTTHKRIVVEKLCPRTNRVIKTVKVDKSEAAKLTHTLSPDLKKRISPPEFESGNMADVSSLGSGGSSGKKQDSVGHKRYLDNPDNIIEKDEKRASGRGSQSRRSGARSTKPKKDSPSLFSDDISAGEYSSSGSRGRGTKRATRADTDDGHTSGEESSSPRKRRRTTDQVTPKPKEPEPLKLTPEEQLNADFPPQNTHSLLPGSRVLARWTDKCFYAATVMVDEGLGRYTVLYYDGAKRTKPRPDLVPITQLKPGDMLMVEKTSESGENDLETVKIVATPPSSDSEKWTQGMYEVENEVQECTERVSWQKFVIDVDQTKHYVSTSVNKAAQDITADNITEKKERSARTRGGAELQQEQEEAEPKEEAAPRTPKQRRSAPRTPRSPPPSRRSAAAATAAASSSTPSTSPKRRSRGGESGRVKKVGATPNSRRNPQIFAGLKFVLTSANRRTKENDASEAVTEEKPTTITFNKKHVRSLIEDHGGAVVDEFTQVIDLTSCFLIADTHYRTHKYLSALARAVPCVKHTWIHECCAAKELLNHDPYMLAAGYSLESDKILPWHDKCPNLLAGKSVLVYTENRPNNPGSLDFVQIWAPLVKCMGANVIETSPSAGTEKVDILLTDATCSPAQLQAAESRGAKAVSSEWLIQAIITGRQPRADGHKKYEYDYVEAAAAAAAGGGTGMQSSGGSGSSGGSANENPTP